jgi:hypothetical protein
MPVQVAQSLDDFLNHRTQEKGAGRLKSWKKDGKLRHFLHTKHPPTAVWAHAWPTIVTLRDRDTNVEIRHVWGRDYTCLESEALLKSQYFRFDDGTRKVPPCACGQCKLNEWFYQRLARGILPIDTPVFKIDGDVQEENTTIYLGGLLNLLKPEKLSDATKSRLVEKGISLNYKHTRRQNLIARANYIVVLCGVDAPADGARITKITAGHGDKIKKAISDEIKKGLEIAALKKGARLSEAEENAIKASLDPFGATPYMFEWTFDPNLDAQNMYGVVAYAGVPASEAVRAVITGDPVDLSREFADLNPAKLRMKLERACILPKGDQPPWDEFFPPAQDDSDEVGASTADDEDVEFPPPAAGAQSTPAPQAAVPSIAYAPPAPSPPPRPKTPEEMCAGVPESELYKCEVCEKGSPIPEKCVWCGAEYDDQGTLTKRPEPAAPPPAPAMRTRATRGTKPKF